MQSRNSQSHDRVTDGYLQESHCSEAMMLPESSIDILDTTSNEESDEDSDEVMSDGEEVTNMLDDSHDSDTD